MPQPLIELGGDSNFPSLHIAIANGFPPQTYIPLLRPLMTDYHVFSLPPRALWGDETPLDDYQDWEMIADDMLAGFDTHQVEDVIAIGHSFGAIATVLAAIKEPQRFKAIIMLDPTILLPSLLDMIRLGWEQGVIDQMPLVQGAMRRRRLFESVEDAFTRFRGKRLFEGWSDEVLRLYVEHGTQPQAQGDGIELSWSAEWEAYYFSTMRLKIWDDLAKFNGLAPTLIIRGGASDTFVVEAQQQVKTLLPSADYEEVPEHGHLFPQSAPQATSDRIQSWLADLDS